MAERNDFKEKLLSMKRDITRRMQYIGEDMLHAELAADWLDQASDSEHDEVLNTLAMSAENTLHAIDAALVRIDLGEYHYCAACGGLIPHRRHESLPFTTLCVQCATHTEQVLHG